MKRQYTINETYSRFESFVQTLPDTFERQGETIYKGRNEIKIMEYDGVRLNVKRYGRPNLLNRYVYAFLRSPKAERAYTYASRLQALEIPTAEPVAYIIERSRGAIAYSYLITLQLPLRRNFYEFGSGGIQGREQILHDFARFTAMLHNKGVLHKDYSPGNILFDLFPDGHAVFSIVDINRMRFGHVSIEQGCKNFARLWGQQPMFNLIADTYADARKANATYCRKLISMERTRFWKKFTKKHTVKFDLDI